MLKKILFALTLCLTTSAALATVKNPVVLMETNLGNVKLELFQKKAPVSVKNFLDYVKSGYYSGTIFHRVIPGFMVQGGGMTAELQPKPTKAPIKNEADNGLENDRGTIAMARSGAPNSATSQFFINVAVNNSLNRPRPDGFGYAVFGRVIEGMDVIDKVATTPQKRLNEVFQNLPETPVVIKSLKVVR